jgi:flavin reductase (DIM6/NTAB) family NADH-FMN oxidoreductase RutF
LNTVSEDLRQAMRHWTTGVCIVCSRHGGFVHGMTVNSFTSISLDPPIISVTLAKNTRTLHLVQESGRFSISILGVDQKDIADRFAGKVPEEGDRFHGLEIFELPGGLIAIKQSLAWLECKVRQQIPFENSILLLADVTYAGTNSGEMPLVYHNRGYYSL